MLCRHRRISCLGSCRSRKQCDSILKMLMAVAVMGLWAGEDSFYTDDDVLDGSWGHWVALEPTARDAGVMKSILMRTVTTLGLERN